MKTLDHINKTGESIGIDFNKVIKMPVEEIEKAFSLNSKVLQQYDHKLAGNIFQSMHTSFIECFHSVVLSSYSTATVQRVLYDTFRSVLCIN